MNEFLENEGRQELKRLLAMCTDPQRHLFKRMYSHKNLELGINEVVDNMPESKIDLALLQCQNTVKKNQKNEIKE